MYLQKDDHSTKTMIKILISVFFFLLLFLFQDLKAQKNVLVFQSDFGLKDGAVSTMKGVAYSVSPDLRMFDLTHEIPAYNIWEAAYRLNQTASYWPAGTVFVSIVDPGVGSNRKSIVIKTKSGHYFVTPDNGTITLVAESLGVDEVREIDETKNRLKNSNDSYTFHGRDVYAYTAARLASGTIKFQEVGAILKTELVKLLYQKPELKDHKIKGTIDVLDVQYGNVWTNINQELIKKLQMKFGGWVTVTIYHEDKLVYEGRMAYEKTFSAVPEGKPVAYLNSLLNFSVGINMGSFADTHHVKSGPGWSIVISQ
jgi:S-adenosylmethionine hydrolase